MTMKKTLKLHVCMSEIDRARLGALSEHYNITISDVLRMLVKLDYDLPRLLAA